MLKLLTYLIFLFPLYRDIYSHKVITHPQSQAVPSGEKAVLQCEYDDDATPCKWSLNGVLIAIELYPNIYILPIAHKLRRGNCTLTIPKVDFKRDDGIWVCFMPKTPSSEAVSARPARLLVVVIPELSWGNNIPKNATKFETSVGQNVTVTCISRLGNPKSTFRWWLNNQTLPALTVAEKDPQEGLFQTRSSVNLTMTKEIDDFILTCEMELIRDKPTIGIYIILSVLYHTSYVRLTHELNTVVRMGHHVNFHCEADGNPPPRYQWMKLKDNSNQWRPVGNSQDYIISSASRSNEGYYFCLAGNNGQLLSSPQTYLKVINGESTSSEVVMIACVITTVVVFCAATILILYLRSKRSRPRLRRPAYLDMKPIEMKKIRPPLPSLPVDACGYLIPAYSDKPPTENNQYVPPDPSTPDKLKNKTDSKNSSSLHIYEGINEYIEVLPPTTTIDSPTTPTPTSTGSTKDTTETTTTTPSNATEQPSNATEQPSNTAEQPSNTAEQPSNTAEQPSNTAEQPSNTAEQPSNTAEQPSNTAEQPSNTAEQPRYAIANQNTPENIQDKETEA